MNRNPDANIEPEASWGYVDLSKKPLPEIATPAVKKPLPNVVLPPVSGGDSKLGRILCGISVAATGFFILCAAWTFLNPPVYWVEIDSGSRDVIIARTYEGYLELSILLARRDQGGITKMKDSGEVFAFPSGWLACTETPPHRSDTPVIFLEVLSPGRPNPNDDPLTGYVSRSVVRYLDNKPGKRL